jgi:hypothetical protein
MTKDEALDKMAENARELGLDYEPVDGTQVSKVWWDGEKLMAKPIPLEDIYQPVQEPVAFVHNETGLLRQANRAKGGDFEPRHWTPLYTTSPAAQPAPVQDIDWKDMYEKEKQRSEMWVAKYEKDIGPLEYAVPVAAPVQELWEPRDTAHRPGGLPQDFTKHEVDSADAWSEWVCPAPKQYFMKCCDCGLVHEMQFKVAKYSEGDECEFVADADLQAVFRARRTTPPAQRQWTGLTDDEIEKLRESFATRYAIEAIEAKLKEKNTAAQPSVPDALTSADIQEHIEYVAGWNDCRQTMLEMMK